MELKVRLCSLAVGYLLGGILTAEIAAKVFAKKPIGKIGTGNPGMANVMANVGKKAGFFVLAVDISLNHHFHISLLQNHKPSYYLFLY